MANRDNATRDDLVSMARWEQLFGGQFGGLFVFAYNVVGDRPLPRKSLFEFRDCLYASWPSGCTSIRDARPISPRWDTGHADGRLSAAGVAGGDIFFCSP